ncbi:MAG: nucleoside triphosphate pyrophosphatase [Acidimicrobiales bacterium]
MPTRQLVLASASPARLRLLREAGFDPTVMVSGVSEEVDDDHIPSLVLTLAERKASAVAARAGDALIIGCDSVFEFEGEAHGKPASAAQAVDWLSRMRGAEGILHTGHCVIDGSSGVVVTATASTVVRFAPMTDDELHAYVDSGEALVVAGAFTLDGRSAPFVKGIDGDPGNVVGLSLPTFRLLLGRVGIEITDLWAP